ncbi:thiol reductant ABC exporter subunit CydC (plasmid) [Devosia neptuniae]|uniref:Thiol reductant ABC exporter subunit CydC n=1 Tax=Devosia neptuniae TaxID=191302 RepID=A0ABY6C686_9HYPH|nr:thiol reductant ABC exporter subunit CydC [Devosia neptuniae]UXN67815.1 thiol reductant ABC exporter subunit CydC [Devosia neptuniae]
MKALLAFRSLFARQARGLLLALILSLVTLAAGIALLGTSGWFITAAALTSAGLAFNLFAPSALVRGFSFIRILARYGERLTGHDATLRLLADIRGWLFARLFPRLPLADRNIRHGDLVSRLTADVDALDTAFLVAVGPVTAALVIGGAVSTILVFLLPAAALVYALCYALAVLAAPVLLVLYTRRAGSQVVARAADARLATLDGIDGHTDLLAMGILGTTHANFAIKATQLAAARGQIASLIAIATAIVQTLAALALVGVLWIGLDHFNRGEIDAALLVGLLLAVLGSFEASNAIVRSVGKLSTAMAAAERLMAMAETPVSVADPAQPQPIPTQAAIVIDNVTFCYGGSAPVLSNINLTLMPGEHIAIVGPSGGGKSSLLKLLLRLSDPQSGRITLGGVPLANLRQADLHAHIALLGQDSQVFHDTIRANLLIGRANASEPDLWAALADAGIADFVRSLPRGLDSLLGETGKTVSAGQGRRLCLARTLLSNAPVILLDEPTTGLDRDAELAFFATIKTAMAGRTTILVTHAAIPDGTVDRVVSIRNGVLGE